MKKVVITGASGFIGRTLVKELLCNDIEVVAILRPNSVNKDRLPKNNKLQIVECELSNLVSLDDKRLLGAEVFYHLAWEGVGYGRDDLDLQLKNIKYSSDALKFASSINCGKFIGIGSIMEKESYTAINKLATKPNPAYIYGAAKYMANVVTKSLAAQMGIKHIWVMITNAYGVGEKSPRFINTTIRKIINSEKLEFTSATQNYDFIYIDDVVQALRLLGDKGRSFHQYILGSGKAGHLRGFIEKIGRELAPKQKLYFGNVPYTGANLALNDFSIKNLIKDTGFSPLVSFEEGIKKTYNYVLSLKDEL